ncbi:MAG TPA: RNA 2',3'-cyclic phosphodiesterase [Candidatus Limnocylindria bacterium]|nr:RNA 2',3'-cyclic phosphodiesterase [Candidatus Limnocylindria bacterium]
MKRCFIAIDISGEARAVIAEHAAALKREFRDIRVSWTKPENLHVTLKFLGDVDDQTVGRVAERLCDLPAFDPVQLTLSKTRSFGKRVLAVAVNDPNGRLGALQDSVEQMCAKLGFERDKRAFRPHITTARIRDQKSVNALIEANRTSAIEPVEFVVESVVLYESKLGPGGSVYTKIA